MAGLHVGDNGDPRRRPPSLHDVGQLAGVSHQTVSRVLNGHANVASVTREKVLRAAAELGYRANTAARALATRRSATIGVLTPASTLLGPTSTAVEWAARDAGFFLSLAVARTRDRADLRSIFHHFLSQAVEGIVVVEPLDLAADVIAEFAGDVPVVVVADAPTSPGSTVSASTRPRARTSRCLI
jgi:DNA-binding LacI/PurR family transcriptional regulator